MDGENGEDWGELVLHEEKVKRDDEMLQCRIDNISRSVHAIDLGEEEENEEGKEEEQGDILG